MSSEPVKTCPRCERELPLSAFGVQRSREDGRNFYCRRCVNLMSKTRRQETKDRAIDCGRQRTLALRDRVFEAIRNGARTQTEIAIAVEDFGYKLKKALQSDRIRSRLLNDQCGMSLTKSELEHQKWLLTDAIGEALALLLLKREIRTTIANGVRIYLPQLKSVQGSGTSQMSLFQYANQFGPRAGGVSAHRGAAEKREAPAGLEPPACSRVA